MASVLDRLIFDLSKLPGVGEKTATRLAFFILRSPKTYAYSLSQHVKEVADQILFCEVCQNFTEVSPCEICASARDKGMILVVESPQDLRSIEKTKKYLGYYHVLHGVLSPLDRVGPEDIKIKELIRRLNSSDLKEIILALNSHVESEATALYLSKLIKPFSLKVTQIASGVPVGGDLEYLDRLTLERALARRHEL